MTSVDLYHAPPQQRTRALWRLRHQDPIYRSRAWKRERNRDRVVSTRKPYNETWSATLFSVEMQHPMPDATVIYEECATTAIQAFIATLMNSREVLVVNVQGPRLLCLLEPCYDQCKNNDERAAHLHGLQLWIEEQVKKFNP